MLDKLMQISLKNRLIVILASTALLITGTIISIDLPVDVFPDLTAPTVTILTEAHGFAPEEVEMLVTFPIETAVNGASGVRRVRSNSIQGLSTIWVEFEWGTYIFKARQIVNEKMQALQNAIPAGVDQPILAPVTSIMGEIMLVGLTSDTLAAMNLRTIADYTLRRRIMAVPGVSQVLVYGGETKQYQVQIDPWHLKNNNLSLNQVLVTVSRTNVNAAGGIFVQSGKEYLIRGIGRIENISELEKTVVAVRKGVPLLLGDVAEVKISAATKIGEASINNEKGIMLIVSKQPDANTLELTDRIQMVLNESKNTLPAGIVMHTDIFKQSDFIELAINNVVDALRDGAILVIVVLMLFLANFRTVIISITAIPLSLIITMIVLKVFDLTVNTMTLGGLAIAIGVLVDDAIIYVENVHRRLRQNALKPVTEQRSFIDVVHNASSEIRTPIVMATFIIIVVFLPLFFLSGVEGRMLRPLGIAYVVSIFASLLVAVTVTPALSSFLLRKIGQFNQTEPWLVRKLKKIYQPSLLWALQHRRIIISVAAVFIISALVTLPFMGRSFLPEFNEGTFNISMATVPGTSLEESDKIGQMVETILLAHPAVKSTARRTGRTELDEHSMGSHAHEMEVQIDLEQISKEKLLIELRNNLSIVPGTVITIGQPISHRIDHMLSGTRANIAVKIFGPDLYKLRSLADKIESQMKNIEGIVDLSKDQQTDVPQVRLKVNRDNIALFGLTAADVDEMIDISFLGLPVSQVYEGQNRHDIVIRYAPQFRDNLDAVRNSLIDLPNGAQIPLKMVTDIQIDKGPNYISRENVQRKIVVQANVADRDLQSVVDDIKSQVAENVSFPQGYYVEYGGQFESATEATRLIMLLSVLSIIAILVALYMEFGNFRQSLLVMVNLPLALIGGVIALFFSEGIITIASMVGFITLFGIAVRNGIIMVSHYNHLIEEEGKSLHDAVVQGSLERLNPILMTALTTGLALLPLALAIGEPGSEIQAPMSIVILGGLLTATFLNMIVIPVLFEKWGVRNRL
ncbi:MAG: efflux RND transporter permease subunit [Calditrichaeota bacterium]|nr:MAG: AcrB/AcrD/AcrF family protein [Calditrichota bacterium]MBL1207346.1 efflux RND transporter permease subunit [Calditrichota bacterium]NOG47179.1 efflux RND transporter permease subunit [Calditrichota bacterium]